MQAGTSTETTIGGGWLECNGVAVSRTTYASLHSLISGLAYPFGSGDGSTTFNLPDARGRSLLHAAAGGHADVNGLGDNDGVALASRTPKHNSTNSLTLSNGSLGPKAALNAAAGSAVVGLDSAASASTPHFGGTGSIGGSVGPGGSRPNDLAPWIVAGVWAVKY